MASEHTSVNSDKLGQPDVVIWTFQCSCRLGVSGQAEDGISPKAEYGEIAVDSDVVMPAP
jgi:hypothetical protein